MEKRAIPKRDALIIVVLVHIGIVLLWVSMGGCGRSTREVDDTAMPDVAEEPETLDTAYPTREPDITIEEPPVTVEPPVRTVEPVNEIRYIVKPGDSLWKISRTFGVTVEAIADRNDIRDPKLIRAGRELWIPNPTKGFEEAATEPVTGTDAGTAADLGVTEPATGGTTEPVEPVDLSAIETFDYVVQPGDTIWKLARTHHTTTKIIMDLNGITDPKKMRAGDTIRIPKPAGE